MYESINTLSPFFSVSVAESGEIEIKVKNRMQTYKVAPWASQNLISYLRH